MTRFSCSGGGIVTLLYVMILGSIRDFHEGHPEVCHKEEIARKSSDLSGHGFGEENTVEVELVASPIEF